jgi:hypothetical protein
MSVKLQCLQADDGGFFCKIIVKLVGWQSFTRGINQTWPEVKEKRRSWDSPQGHVATYCLNMAISHLFFLMMWRFGPIFLLTILNFGDFAVPNLQSG